MRPRSHGLLTAVLFLPLAACTNPKEAAPVHPQSVGPASTAAPLQLPTPQQLGDPTVVWSSIGLTGGSTYLTAVVFRVHNSSGQALLRVPYRVEVLGPEGPLYVSSGQDSFSLSSGATRVVVWDGSVDRTQPTSARVTLYTPMPATTSANMQLTAIDQSKVEYSHLGINCSGLVECQLTGDLTWHGDQPVLPSSVAAVVHKGADTKGPIIAAGHGPLQFNLGQMLQPGQTAPFSISLAGNQARPDGPGDQSVIRAGVTTELVLD